MIMFCYVRGVGPKAQAHLAAMELASLRPTMPLVALRVVLQEMAVGVRSANPIAAQSVKRLL